MDTLLCVIILNRLNIIDVLCFYFRRDNMVQLITDSSADLPRELLDKYNIAVVPLTINLNGEEYLEGVDLSSQEFFQRMYVSKELPKTSQPSPSTFANVFKELSTKGDLLCLTISSGLSGTYQSACIGKDLSGTNVTIFDTLGGSLAHGLQLIKAAGLAAEGLTIDEIVRDLSEYKKSMNILVMLDTLENIVKGGRLNKFQGAIAKILDIRILLEGVNGQVALLEKIRGKKRFLLRALDIIGERKKDFSDSMFGITHVDNEEDVEFLKNEITKRFNPKGIIVNYMGATMGTYAGKGGMIVSFY
jgi:DegV family protein with EDD domain